MSTEYIEDISIDEKIKETIEEPSKYKVIALNDDQTPIDWVTEILQSIFRHSEQTAHDITLQIHNEGSAVIGIYSYEIAESKVTEAVNRSRANGFPLQLRMEKE